jgi:hypothetical protein
MVIFSKECFLVVIGHGLPEFRSPLLPLSQLIF